MAQSRYVGLCTVFVQPAPQAPVSAAHCAASHTACDNKLPSAAPGEVLGLEAAAAQDAATLSVQSIHLKLGTQAQRRWYQQQQQNQQQQLRQQRRLRPSCANDAVWNDAGELSLGSSSAAPSGSIDLSGPDSAAALSGGVYTGTLDTSSSSSSSSLGAKVKDHKGWKRRWTMVGLCFFAFML